MEFDKTKFSFIELFLNTDGKTSITKLIGFASSFTCLIMFVVMIVFYMFHVGESSVVLDFVDKIIMFFGISSGLMGIKSISSSFGSNNRVPAIGGDTIMGSVRKNKTKTTAKIKAVDISDECAGEMETEEN